MKALETQLAALWPPQRWCDVTTLVAVSGGADSVALLRILAALRASAGGPAGPGRLIVAHFNHHLRAADSDEDQRFVEVLARQHALEVQVGHAESRPSAPPLPPVETPEGLAPASRSEATARAQRYEFLIATARHCGARYVATAHTADDQAETVLHHVLRGTGLAGLAGIPAARELTPGVALVRPLLSVRRQEVLAYLDEIGQPSRQDATNLDAVYTRNRIRHELLPRLAEQFNPQVVDALLRLGRLAGEAQQVIDVQTQRLAERCVRPGVDEEVILFIREFADEPRYLVRELLISVWRERGWPLGAMSLDHWEQLAALATVAPSNLTSRKRVFPGEVVVERDAERLSIVRRKSTG